MLTSLIFSFLLGPILYLQTATSPIFIETPFNPLELTIQNRINLADEIGIELMKTWGYEAVSTDVSLPDALRFHVTYHCLNYANEDIDEWLNADEESLEFVENGVVALDPRIRPGCPGTSL